VTYNKLAAQKEEHVLQSGRQACKTISNLCGAIMNNDLPEPGAKDPCNRIVEKDYGMLLQLSKVNVPEE
jgi:hypothetical protein